MKALLARYQRTLAMLAVFVAAMVIAVVAKPPAAPAADEAERMLGPTPATDIVTGDAGAAEVEAPVKKPTPKPTASKGYTVEAVENGGTIQGVVRLAAAATPWQVERGKDKHACGEGSSLTERMIVGDDGRTLANTVLWLADISKGKAWTGDFAKGPDERTALLDQVKCIYVPHILVVRTETQLALKNSDPAEHNVHAYFRDFKTTQLNLMTAANILVPEAADAYIEKAGKYIVKCDIHSWMSGYVHAFAHPYYAVTGKDGRFEIKDVPPGTYTLVCWHEGMQEKPLLGGDGGIAGYDYGPDFETSVSITVEAGKTATRDFTVPNPK
ncbi:MAG: carboxypeptidase regulatory-like domain-containing protein [Planctomycetota bacterium]|nr:carboxypeptidase regulatory-like domain-containing protein [Planctomycetota bacterium]